MKKMGLLKKNPLRKQKQLEQNAKVVLVHLKKSKPSAKKTKDEKEETETPKSDSSGEKKKRRSQQEKDALPKKKASKTVKKEEPENVSEPMEVENVDAETKTNKVK